MAMFFGNRHYSKDGLGPQAPANQGIGFTQQVLTKGIRQHQYFILFFDLRYIPYQFFNRMHNLK
jgi:hypothetical protein